MVERERERDLEHGKFRDKKGICLSRSHQSNHKVDATNRNELHQLHIIVTPAIVIINMVVGYMSSSAQTHLNKGDVMLAEKKTLKLLIYLETQKK